MPSTGHNQSSLAPGPAHFGQTHWSVVLAAGRSRQTTRARAALEELCRAYWRPIYAFVRREGHSPHDAQDLTQEFFARLLQKNYLGSVDPAKGRFRSFLLTALKHFLANEWDKARAQKRGGGQPLIALDVAAAEESLAHEPADNTTADKIFDQRWAMSLLDQVMSRLRAEYNRDGKGAQFEQLKTTLVGERQSLPYAEIGARLGSSQGAVKVAVHRLRQRYRELIRAEIANTVATPADVEEELRALFAALGS